MPQAAIAATSLSSYDLQRLYPGQLRRGGGGGSNGGGKDLQQRRQRRRWAAAAVATAPAGRSCRRR